MSGLYTRVMARVWRYWFTLIHGPSFRSLGRGSFLFRPFRVDGAEGIEVGEKTVMQRGAWLYCCGVDDIPASLKIGKGCVFGYNNHIAAVRDVAIGNNVLTANNVYISDNLHAYEDISRPVMHQPVRFKGAVSIGEGSWIGENACIIGARIGRNCVIGANAVVTRDIPDYSVAAGVPAVVIRQFDPRLDKWVRPDS
ncbi:MAG: acyltransferase [Nitrosomonadales bacterium]|nr:acyltransferase [Nitrosomonadales bacterium]